MNQQQLTEHYYEVLNEGRLGNLWKLGWDYTTRGAKATGRGLARGAGVAAPYVAGAAGTLLPYAAAGYALNSLPDLIGGIFGSMQDLVASAGGGGRRSSGGFDPDYRERNKRVMDYDAAEALSKGDTETFDRFMADIQNSNMTSNAKTGSLIRTRALASKIARERANQLKNFALSDKTEEGKRYIAARAAYDTEMQKADARVSDPSKTLRGKRPNGRDFEIPGESLSQNAQRLKDEMDRARKAALDREITVGDVEGPVPEEEEKKKSSSTTPVQTSESFRVNKYYNILLEKIVDDERAPTPDAQKKQSKQETEAESTPEETKAKAEELKAQQEQVKAQQEAEARAAQEAAKFEKERRAASFGSARGQMEYAASLQSGPMNLQPVERRGVRSSGRRYVHPDSPEGRIEAEIKADPSKDIWDRDEFGNLIPGQGIQGDPNNPYRVKKREEREWKADYAAKMKKLEDEIKQQVKVKEAGPPSIGVPGLLQRDEYHDYPAPMISPQERMNQDVAKIMDTRKKEIGERLYNARTNLSRRYAEWQTGTQKSNDELSTEAGEDLLRKMQDYQREVEADRFRNAPPTIGVPELLRKPVSTPQRDYVSVPPKSPDYPTPRTPEEEKKARQEVADKAKRGAQSTERELKTKLSPSNPYIPQPKPISGATDFDGNPVQLEPTTKTWSGRVFPRSPDYPSPAREYPPKSPDYPSPATPEDSAKRISKTAQDIRTRAARYAKSRDAQRKTTSDASIRGAGMELRKNIGTIADKTGLSDLLYRMRKTFEQNK